MANFFELLGSINPMDFVKGQEAGLKLGEQRARTEQSDIRTELMRTRDVPEARRAGENAAIDYEAIIAQRPTVLEGREAALQGIADLSRREALVQETLRETQPQRSAEFKGKSALQGARLDEVLARDTTEFGIQGAEQKQRAEAIQAREAGLRSSGEVYSIETDLDSNPDTAGLPPFDKYGMGAERAKDKAAKAYFARKQQTAGADQLAAFAAGANWDEVNNWMGKLGKPYVVERAYAPDSTGAQVPVIAIFPATDIPQPDGTTRRQRFGKDALATFKQATIATDLPLYLGISTTAQRREAQQRQRAPATPRAAAAPRAKAPTAADKLRGAGAEGGALSAPAKQEAALAGGRDLAKETRDLDAFKLQQSRQIQQRQRADPTGSEPWGANPSEQRKLVDSVLELDNVKNNKTLFDALSRIKATGAPLPQDFAARLQEMVAGAGAKPDPGLQKIIEGMRASAEKRREALAALKDLGKALGDAPSNVPGQPAP